VRIEHAIHRDHDIRPSACSVEVSQVFIAVEAGPRMRATVGALVREQAFLASIRIGLRVLITFRSDGGGALQEDADLPVAATRVLRTP